MLSALHAYCSSSTGMQCASASVRACSACQCRLQWLRPERGSREGLQWSDAALQSTGVGALFPAGGPATLIRPEQQRAVNCLGRPTKWVHIAAHSSPWPTDRSMLCRHVFTSTGCKTCSEAAGVCCRQQCSVNHRGCTRLCDGQHNHEDFLSSQRRTQQWCST